MYLRKATAVLWACNTMTAWLHRGTYEESLEPTDVQRVNVTSTLISPFFPLQMEKQQICSLLQGSRSIKATNQTGASLFLASTSAKHLVELWWL